MIEVELLELLEKVKAMKAESQTLELKAANAGCPKRLYDTISAFSNQDSGGIILFGIDESKGYEVVGVYDAQDLQKKVTEQCKQMEPVVRPVFTAVQTGSGIVVSAEIPGIDVSERPCYYRGVGRVKGSYVRSGDSDEPMSDYEIYSYEAFRRKYQDDIRINEKADLRSIDTKKLEAYVNSIKENNPKLAQLPEELVLQNLSMMKEGRPTLACTLLFSVYPQMFYPQYTVNAMVVMGYEKGETAADGSRFIDNKRIEGTLPEMLEETMKFLSKNMKVRTIVNPVTGERADKTEYPVIALREAVLNAIIHRDYSMHTEAMPIEVVMYKDRVEIRSPGGLYGRLTVDKLGKVQPDTRNPVLARAMETLGKTENRHSGIPTMVMEMRKAGLEGPVFENLRNEFAVIFYNAHGKETEKPESGEKDLLVFCREPRTRAEIAEYLGLETVVYAVQNYVRPLVEAGELFLTIPEHPRSKNQKYYSK